VIFEASPTCEPDESAVVLSDRKAREIVSRLLGHKASDRLNAGRYQLGQYRVVEESSKLRCVRIAEIMNRDSDDRASAGTARRD
jgi:hypothetical protein